MGSVNKRDFSLARHVGAVAREARARAGLTQAEVAERAELATEVYARLERGLMLPSVPSLLRLCRALGVDANSLLGLVTDTPPPWLAQAAPPSEERPALRRLLRSVRRLGAKQVDALTNVARFMGAAPGPRPPKQAAR